jgi:hypothetical protein
LDLTGFSRPFLDFWLAASIVNTIISAFLPSRVVILCLRLDFLFIWFQSFRLDLPSSSSWLISFVWKHYVPVSLFVSRENLRGFEDLRRLFSLMIELGDKEWGASDHHGAGAGRVHRFG